MVRNLPANAVDAGDMGSIPGSGRSPGGGNGNPLQYSCLGNPMERQAWRATVHGVAESWTPLSDWAGTNLEEVTHNSVSQFWNIQWEAANFFMVVYFGPSTLSMLWLNILPNSLQFIAKPVGITMRKYGWANFWAIDGTASFPHSHFPLIPQVSSRSHRSWQEWNTVAWL